MPTAAAFLLGLPPLHAFTSRAASSDRPMQNVRGWMSPAPQAARVHGAAAIKEGLYSLIFSFSNHILLEQRDLAELSRPQPVTGSKQGEEGGAGSPAVKHSRGGLGWGVRSHQNPPPKALSVHHPTARASRGPTRPGAAVDSQEASASKWFIACLHWVDHPAPTPGHGRWGCTRCLA